MPLHVGRLWLGDIVKKLIKTVITKYPFIENLRQADIVRFWVMIDMAYNLGPYNKKTLLRTMTELNKQLTKKRPNYKRVVSAMKSGAWFNQVGNRSKILAKRMETGTWA